MTKYEDIEKVLKDRISAHVYSPMQKLPSEYQFANEFKTSRLTIRKVINSLIQQQILVKDPGRGTYVMNNVTPEKIASGVGGLQSFTEVAKLHHKKAHAKVLKVKQILDPSQQVRNKLALDKRLDQSAILLERIRYWDQDPMTYERIYICSEYLKNFRNLDFSQSLFDLLNKNVEISCSHEEIEAILVDQKIANLLNLAVGDPLFKVTSTIFTPDAKPISFDTSYYRADKYSFKSTLTRYQ